MDEDGLRGLRVATVVLLARVIDEIEKLSPGFDRAALEADAQAMVRQICAGNEIATMSGEQIIRMILSRESLR